MHKYSMAAVFLSLFSGSIRAESQELSAQEALDGSYFLRAVKEQDAARASSYLANPASHVPQVRDADGEGALHIVTMRRDVAWMSLLLARGAAPDFQDRKGDTSLILASRIGWLEGAVMLLKHGSGPNTRNGRTGETPLIAAVKARNLAGVRLLLSWKADPEQKDREGSSAIDYARNDPLATAIYVELRHPR